MSDPGSNQALNTVLTATGCVQNCSVDVWEREREDARHAQRAAKLLAVEGILWGERPPKRLWESLKNACKRHASFQLMRVLEVGPLPCRPPAGMPRLCCSYCVCAAAAKWAKHAVKHGAHGMHSTHKDTIRGTSCMPASRAPQEPASCVMGLDLHQCEPPWSSKPSI